MADNMSPYSGPWYSGQPEQQSASAWYQAGGRPTPPPPPPGQPSLRRGPTEQQRRRHHRTKVASLCLCTVLLCAAAALAVWRSGLLRRFNDLALSRAVYGYDFDGGFDYGYDFGSDTDTLPADGYEDYREYFANYYTGSNEIKMPKAPTGTGVTLSLRAQRGEDLTLQEIYDKVSPAVVGITSYVDGEEYAWGTGVVFDSDAGYIVTNTHIIQGCERAQVILSDGQMMDALLVGADENSDIAVIQVEDQTLPAAEFGRSVSLRVGDEVVAIGNPLGQAYTGTMTNGIISAIDRNVTYDGHTMTLLQTNAALNEGNSGGPLINAEGQVIGITNMKIMSGFYTTVEGIGFAIPSSVVKQIADQLIENGVVPGEPTIGIVAGTVNTDAMERYGLPSGLYVTEVSEGSDAKEKGLREGDVITAVNGTEVTTVAQVNVIKEAMEVGDAITLTVWRDGESFELEIKLVDKGDIQ